MKNSAVRFSLIVAIGLLASFLAGPAWADPGELYVSDDGGLIYKYRGDGLQSTFASGLFAPRGLAFDGKGFLYSSDSSKNVVYRHIVGQPGSASVYISNLGVPQGLAFDTNGNLFVADSLNKAIYKFTLDLTKSTFASGLGEPTGIAFDRNGNLFVADGTAHKVIKVTPAGVKTTFASGLNQPRDLAFDSAGNLFVTDAGADRIYKYTPAGVRTIFASGLFGPFGLAFDDSGNLYEASFGFNTIYKFTPNGMKTTFKSGDMNGPSFLAFEPHNEKLRNISTRGLVQTGNDILIAGFYLGGNGLILNSLAIRAIGPSLAAQGIGNALPNPTIALYNASGTVIASNNDWQDGPKARIEMLGLAPSDPRESVILTTLPAGAYTATVRGANKTTGAALVEVYSIR